MRITAFRTAILFYSLCAITSSANAGYDIQLNDVSKLTLGGYLKIDTRYVNGDVAYKDFWSGTGTPLAESTSQFKIFAKESRFNMRFDHGDVSGFVETDFYGSDGNEVISNSYSPRLRHAFITYQGLTVGQTWTTFMNTSAIPESADFGGAMVGLAFVRQGQIRYDIGNFQFSLENPESFGGNSSKDKLPDVVARYNFKGDWGNVSVSALGRQLNTQLGQSETAIGGSLSGKIKTIGKDDFRFQFHKGELGRYVGVAAAKDLIDEQIEDTTAYIVSYRHYWNDTLRSTFLYGNIETNLDNADHSQWSINIFQNLTPQLVIGFEIGNFAMKDKDADSDYAQLSVKYTL